MPWRDGSVSTACASNRASRSRRPPPDRRQRLLHQPCLVGRSSSPRPSSFPIWALGHQSPSHEAKLATGLPDPTPALLGDPQSVHVVQPPATGQIVLVYPPSSVVPQSTVIGAGALVSVMPAHIEQGLLPARPSAKTSTVRPVDVDGDVGYWIEGSPHQLMFEFGDQIEQDTLRLATNTLLWERGRQRLSHRGRHRSRNGTAHRQIDSLAEWLPSGLLPRCESRRPTLISGRLTISSSTPVATIAARSLRRFVGGGDDHAITNVVVVVVADELAQSSRVRRRSVKRTGWSSRCA